MSFHNLWYCHREYYFIASATEGASDHNLWYCYREYYSLERNKFMEHMRHMDDDLRLTRAALQKELEWKDKMDSNYKHLLDEKRNLISQ